jgi:hypothetical protein
MVRTTALQNLKKLHKVVQPLPTRWKTAPPHRTKTTQSKIRVTKKIDQKERVRPLTKPRMNKLRKREMLHPAEKKIENKVLKKMCCKYRTILLKMKIIVIRKLLF